MYVPVVIEFCVLPAWVFLGIFKKTHLVNLYIAIN